MVGFLLFVLGLVFGSFGNVLVMRIPKGEDIGGRSHCPRCGRVLQPWELIPVVSFLFLRGQCFGCKERIALQYPLTELAAGCLFLLAGWMHGFDFLPSLIIGLAFWVMLLISIIDGQTQMIPDVMTGFLLLCAVSYHLLLHTFDYSGALLALAFFGIQWLLSRGKWVGSGDIFLSVALGFLLGTWVHLLIGLMLAYIIGALFVSVLLGLSMIHRSQHIAFGPFLTIGALVAFIYADQIVRVVWPM